MGGRADAERALVEAWRPRARRGIVGCPGRLAWDAKDIAIEFVVAVQVLKHAYGIGTGRQIGIDMQLLRTGGTGGKPWRIAFSRSPGNPEDELNTR